MLPIGLDFFPISFDGRGGLEGRRDHRESSSFQNDSKRLKIPPKLKGVFVDADFAVRFDEINSTWDKG